MKTIQVMASLVKANHDDLMHFGVPFVNKNFYLFSKPEHHFRGVYTTGCKYPYQYKEAHRVLLECYVYKLVTYDANADFSFPINLVPACIEDLSYSPGLLKTNKIYFVRNDDYINGPFEIKETENRKYEKFKVAIDSEKLWVPVPEQEALYDFDFTFLQQYKNNKVA